MRSDEGDERDRLLDEALSSYSAEEPRPGLEQRVLNRIRAEAGARRRAWAQWYIAIPALCLLAVVALVGWPRREPAPAPRRPVAQAPEVKKPVVVPTRMRKPARQPRTRVAGLPKLEQFPSPSPLTEEERALLEFVMRSPKDAQAFLGDVEIQSVEPIRIEEIHIEPLQSGG